MVKATLRKPTPAAAAAAGTPGATTTTVVSPKPALPEDITNAMDIPSETSSSDDSAEAEQQENGNTAVATRPPQAPPSRFSADSDGAVEGDWDQDDIRLPQFKIVNGSGKLSQDHNQGTLLVADEVLWGPPDPKGGTNNPSTRLVVVQMTKQYRENLTQDEVEDGIMPRIASSREEAERLGGTTRWENDEKPRWAPSAKILLLVEEPEGGSEHPAFSIELDGKRYAPCVYYASGKAFNVAAKTIFNLSNVNLRDAKTGKVTYESRFWTVQIAKVPAGKFVVFCPQLKLTRDETGPEVRAMALSMRGAKVAIDASDE